MADLARILLHLRKIQTVTMLVFVLLLLRAVLKLQPGSGTKGLEPFFSACCVNNVFVQMDE